MQIAVSAPRNRSPLDISILSQDPGLAELTAIKIPFGHPNLIHSALFWCFNFNWWTDLFPGLRDNWNALGEKARKMGFFEICINWPPDIPIEFINTGPGTGGGSLSLHGRKFGSGQGKWFTAKVLLGILELLKCLLRAPRWAWEILSSPTFYGCCSIVWSRLIWDISANDILKSVWPLWFWMC